MKGLQKQNTTTNLALQKQKRGASLYSHPRVGQIELGGLVARFRPGAPIIYEIIVYGNYINCCGRVWESSKRLKVLKSLPRMVLSGAR